MRATSLFAAAFAAPPPAGERVCAYCGAACDDTFPARQHVRDTFTARSSMAAPDSPAVCAGCVEAMTAKGTVPLVDGEVRTGQKRWLYSWVLTPTSAVAATKAHLTYLRETCLAPPPPPYAIVLADSGKIHQAYLAPVALDPARAVVTLETEVIRYTPAELREALDVAGVIASVLGKRALGATLPIGLLLKLVEQRGEEGQRALARWDELRCLPLGRLAAWLCPGKEELCRNPSPTTTSAAP